MNTYYVAHPHMKKSAVVHAPTTEKARTTFLDYLERGGYIQRRHRQHWRKDMVAERIEEPERALTDLVLHYGYEEAGPHMTLGEERPFEEVEEDLREGEDWLQQRGARRATGLPDLEEEEPVISEEPPEKRGMPIQEAATRGFI